MAPKGINSKKEAGKNRKAVKADKQQQEVQAKKELNEAEKWKDGAKEESAKEEKAKKRQEALAAKAERDRLLAEEEAKLPSKGKTVPKAGRKKHPTPSGPGATAAEGLPAVANANARPEEIESFSATGIDSALELMEVVTAKTDKANVGQQAAEIERHPERRFKGAFQAYMDRELPTLRRDNPGLRLQQCKELAYKQFQKSPENPFNQTYVAYDTTQEERVEALQKRKQDVEDRLREGS